MHCVDFGTFSIKLQPHSIDGASVIYNEDRSN